MPDKIAQIGRQAALAAGAVMRQNYHQPHEITMKGAIDPVTESDLQAQEMIIALIRQIFPDQGLFVEAGFKPALTSPARCRCHQEPYRAR